MCQAYPLPRCINHAAKTVDHEIAKYQSLHRQLSQKEREYTSLHDKTSLTAEHIKHECQQLKKDTDTQAWVVWIAEVHKDATLTGYRQLKDDPQAPNQVSRLRNAELLRAWHKRLRQTRDKDGHKLFTPEADKTFKAEFLRTELDETLTQSLQEQAAYHRNNVILQHLKYEQQHQPTDENSFHGARQRAQENDAQALKEHTRILMKNHYAILLLRAKLELLEKVVKSDTLHKRV